MGLGAYLPQMANPNSQLPQQLDIAGTHPPYRNPPLVAALCRPAVPGRLSCHFTGIVR